MTPHRSLAGLALVAVLAVGCASPQGSASPSPAATTAAPTGDASSPGPSAPVASQPVPSGPGSTGPFDPAGLAVTLEPVADGFQAPLAVVAAYDTSNRIFVVEKGGTIRIVQDGAVMPNAFLDISSAVSRGGEQGLLGLAFHPDFPDDPRFFVNYTDTSGDTRVSSFTVDPSNPDRADPDSEVELLFIDQPYSNHNGGALAFGQDGYLYIGVGDGGSGGDPHGNGQKLGTLLAKVLRIDVDSTTGDRSYGIPADNPFASTDSARPEIYALGLRNPWRLSFDRETGDLWIGDVGQGAWEEVDVARAGTSGANFGWNRMEGSHCYRPSDGCDASGLTLPVTEYSHDTGGCTVIGGYVYRGTAQPELAGGYLFGDYCSGTIWAIDPAGDELREPTVVSQSDASISSFGEDEAGELYATDIRSGQLLRVVASRS